MMSSHYSTTHRFALLPCCTESPLLCSTRLVYNTRDHVVSPRLMVQSSVWEVNKVRKVTNFLAGFLLGGLTGAVAGLLLAPRQGSDLQRQIRARLDALIEEGQRAAAARQAELEAQLEAFKSGEAVTIEPSPQR